jgi:hypothetical protein
MLGSSSITVESASADGGTATPGQIAPLDLGWSDSIWNYDANKYNADNSFVCDSGYTTCNVDWGTSLLFYSAASVNGVKATENAYGYVASGGPEFAKSTDVYGCCGQGTTWDTDSARIHRG